MWYCSLNAKSIDQAQFDKYYSLFIQIFVGDSFPLRSCFFLSDSFDRVLERWKKSTVNSRDQRSISINVYYEQHNPKHAYKVIECLSQNRATTIEQIATLTQLSEQEIIKVLDDYSITQSSYHHYIDQYDSVYQSDTSIDVTTGFLNHLVIIPLREEQGKVVKDREAKHNSKDQKYELSLLGILLLMGEISLTRQQSAERVSPSVEKYYGKIASNYQDKLPLIFGKWRLLKQALRFDFFPSIFDYLFLGKSEILSLSVLLGGNKEIYDNIKSAALSTINKYSIIYDHGTSTIESNDLPVEFVRSKHYHFILKKLDEIQILLRYSDLESFVRHIKSKKKPMSNLLRLPPNTSIKNMPELTFGELYTKYSTAFR